MQARVEKLFDKMRSTLLKKGNDYSNEDRLSNFKQVGTLCGLHPAKVALVVAAIKITRLCNLLDSGKKPENESIEDSALDLCNYGILDYLILLEESEQIKPKKNESKTEQPL